MIQGGFKDNTFFRYNGKEWVPQVTFEDISLINDKLDLIFKTICLSSRIPVDPSMLKQYFELEAKGLRARKHGV